jgi:hypothetical protein
MEYIKNTYNKITNVSTLYYINTLSNKINTILLVKDNLNL